MSCSCSWAKSATNLVPSLKAAAVTTEVQCQQRRCGNSHGAGSDSNGRATFRTVVRRSNGGGSNGNMEIRNGGVAAGTAVRQLEQRFERRFERQCGSPNGGATTQTSAVRTAVWQLGRRCSGSNSGSSNGGGSSSSAAAWTAVQWLEQRQFERRCGCSNGSAAGASIAVATAMATAAAAMTAAASPYGKNTFVGHTFGQPLV